MCSPSVLISLYYIVLLFKGILLLVYGNVFESSFLQNEMLVLCTSRPDTNARENGSRIFFGSHPDIVHIKIR